MKNSQAELLDMWNVTINSNLILLLSTYWFNKYLLSAKHYPREGSCSCESLSINK